MSEQRSSTGRRGFLRRAPGFLAVVAGGAALSGLRPGRLFALGPAAKPAEAGGENWIGEIVTVPYSFAPRGFAFCEGQEMPVQQHQALFSLIGTYFGGDGRTTFKLPDTRPLELAHQKQLRASRPPFRYAIALTGLFPSRS
jgi:hypothetical protein